MSWGQVGSYTGVLLGGGVLGGIITAWNNWTIDNKRTERDRGHDREDQIRGRHAQLVEAARAGLGAWEVLNTWNALDSRDANNIVREPWYVAIRSDLSDETRESCEGLELNMPGPGRKWEAIHISEDLGRLEREWGLR